jgi:hypothetical protein
MEGVHWIKVHYMHVWKHHNEPCPTIKKIEEEWHIQIWKDKGYSGAMERPSGKHEESTEVGGAGLQKYLLWREWAHLKNTRILPLKCEFIKRRVLRSQQILMNQNLLRCYFKWTLESIMNKAAMNFKIQMNSYFIDSNKKYMSSR